jgi:hypothetical protein
MLNYKNYIKHVNSCILDVILFNHVKYHAIIICLQVLDDGPKWTSTHQHTMQDEWCMCVDKKHTFLLRYIPAQELTTLVGYVLTMVVSFALNHPHASTYLVTTKCLNVMLSSRHIWFGTKLVWNCVCVCVCLYIYTLKTRVLCCGWSTSFVLIMFGKTSVVYVFRNTWNACFYSLIFHIRWANFQTLQLLNHHYLIAHLCCTMSLYKHAHAMFLKI